VKIKRIRAAIEILIKTSEKTGTWVKVSFIIGAVAPQMMAAEAVNKKAELSFNLISNF